MMKAGKKEMYYQECTKRSPDDYFSLRNVRTWQTAFETQQSMAAETTSKIKYPELKELEKQVPFSSWVSWKKKKATQTYSCPVFKVIGLFFHIHTNLWLCTIKFIEVEHFFFRGINHSSRQQKTAKRDKDNNTLWYLFIFEQVFHGCICKLFSLWIFIPPLPCINFLFSPI